MFVIISAKSLISGFLSNGMLDLNSFFSHGYKCVNMLGAYHVFSPVKLMEVKKMETRNLDLFPHTHHYNFLTQELIGNGAWK